MIFVEMKLISPLEMGNETYQCTIRAPGHLNEHGLKSLLKNMHEGQIKGCKLTPKVQEGQEGTRRFAQNTEVAS
jgi:hypothetical protein